MQVATTSIGSGGPTEGLPAHPHRPERRAALATTWPRPAPRHRLTASFCALAALLLLGGCISRPRPVATDDRYAPLVEGPNMLIVRGEDVQEKPLTPEPGDVWADIVPDRKQALAEATPPKVAKGTTPTGVGSAKGAATAITTPLEADWPVAQAAQTAAGQSVPADAMITPPAAPAEGKPPRAADGKVPNAAPATSASSNEAAGPAKPAASGGGKPATLAMGSAAPPAAPVVGKTREHEVQLAAAGSPAEAEAKWARLAERYPALLRGRSPILRQGEANGRPVWRLRTGGFANGAEASAFCDRLRGAGLSCWVARSI